MLKTPRQPPQSPRKTHSAAKFSDNNTPSRKPKKKSSPAKQCINLVWTQTRSKQIVNDFINEKIHSCSVQITCQVWRQRCLQVLLQVSSVAPTSIPNVRRRGLLVVPCIIVRLWAKTARDRPGGKKNPMSNKFWLRRTSWRKLGEGGIRIKYNFLVSN